MAGWALRPGRRGIWYQLHPRAAVVMAVVLFSVVSFAAWAYDSSGQAIVLFYVLPIALLAIAFGLRGGLIGAVTGFGLFAILEVFHSSGDIDGEGWVVRALAMFLLGGLLGHASDRTESSERTALAEQQRRCRIEEANRRYAEAMEISDSLVQQMVAAKWMAEQGQSTEAIEVLASTIAAGESMARGLLQRRAATPLDASSRDRHLAQLGPVGDEQAPKSEDPIPPTPARPLIRAVRREWSRPRAHASRLTRP